MLLLFSSGLWSSAAVIQLRTLIKCCCYSGKDLDQVLLSFNSGLDQVMLFSSGLWSSDAVIQIRTVIKWCCYSAQDLDQVLLLFSSGLWSSAAAIQLRTWIKCCCYSTQDSIKWCCYSAQDCDQVLLLFSSGLWSSAAVIQLGAWIKCCCYSDQDSDNRAQNTGRHVRMSLYSQLARGEEIVPRAHTFLVHKPTQFLSTEHRRIFPGAWSWLFLSIYYKGGAMPSLLHTLSYCIETPLP